MHLICASHCAKHIAFLILFHPPTSSVSLRQEIVRKEELRKRPRAKIKDTDTGQRPCSKTLCPPFWKSAES